MRISDLDQITNGAMDLSQFIALDDPGQTFKATLLQLSDFLQAHILGNVFNVGSTLYRVDNRTPNEAGFPGTWALAPEDVTLATGLASGTDTGTYTGTNAPSVPLPSHSHTASQPAHGHGASQDAHSHTVGTASGATREHCSDGCQEGSLVNMGTGTTSTSQPAVYIQNAQPAITVNATGVASPTLDVRGLHLNGKLWIRTA